MSSSSLRGQLTVEGMEVHDITDNDLFRFFLNEEELSKPATNCPSPSCSFSCSCSSSSSPDSSQSGSMSSPDQDFESPPSSPFSSPPTLPYVEVKSEKDTNINSTSSFLAPFWPSSLSLPTLIKEEPKDILQSFNLAGLDLSSPISLDMAVNALDQELKKRKSALGTKAEAASPTKTTPANSNSAALSREDLLKLSSKSIETYAHSLGSNRSLSEEEERQLKRQRRLIKNRESAQLSRQRKRLYIEELEKKVTALTTENNELIKQVALLTTENATFREESFQFQNFIKQMTETQKKSLAPAIPPVKLETVTDSKTSTKLEAGSPVAPCSPQSSAEFAATVVPQIDNDEVMVVDSSDKTDASSTPSPLYYYLEHPEELRKIVSANRKKGKKRRKDEGSTCTDETEESTATSSTATQIYFCPEARDLKMAEKRSTRAASGKQLNGTTISFLLPYTSVYPSFPTKTTAGSSSSLNSPLSHSDCNTLVELSCQVTETRTHTLSLPLKCERVAAVSSM